MTLDPAKIRELMNKKNAPRIRKTGPRTSKGKALDPNDRSHIAWFAMEHKLINHDTLEMIFCDNPDCVDPRENPYGQTVVEINGKNVCRFCFVNGWLLENPDQAQTTLVDNG